MSNLFQWLRRRRLQRMERGEAQLSIRQPEQLVQSWRRQRLLDLWQLQVERHHAEQYRGIPMAKFPQDLWSYEGLIDRYQPDVVMEVGIFQGGFSRWLFDRLHLLPPRPEGRRRHLIGLDLTIETARGNLREQLLSEDPRDPVLHLHQCDLTNAEQVRATKQAISPLCSGSKLLLIEDSGHTAATTRSALAAFSDLVPIGGWLVVEDTCVDLEALRQEQTWPRGALTALQQFLDQHPNFSVNTVNHRYGITCHPYGFLQRTH